MSETEDRVFSAGTRVTCPPHAFKAHNQTRFPSTDSPNFTFHLRLNFDSTTECLVFDFRVDVAATDIRMKTHTHILSPQLTSALTRASMGDSKRPPSSTTASSPERPSSKSSTGTRFPPLKSTLQKKQKKTFRKKKDNMHKQDNKRCSCGRDCFQRFLQVNSER